MRICFCIPTYNRAPKLLATLQNIEKYARLSSHQVHIYVSNNCSSDNTSFVLEDFANKNDILSYKNRDTFVTTGHYSAIKLITEVPENYDWYWFFGDDDYIIEENAKSLDETFLRNDISYIYAPVADDVLNKFEIDTVPNLVDKHGFIQLLSFISSQIINNQALQNARRIIANSAEIDVRNLFAHSFVLYEALFDLNGCIHPHALSDTYPERPGDWKFVDWIYTSKYLAKTIDSHYSPQLRPIGFFKYRDKIIWRWYFSCIMRFIISLEGNAGQIQAHYGSLMESLHLLLELTKRLDSDLVSSSDQLAISLGIVFLKHISSERGNSDDSKMILDDIRVVVTNTIVLWER